MKFFGINSIHPCSIMRISTLYLSVVFAILQNVWVISTAEVLYSAEFVEPLKNITASVGNNVEFSCAIRNLDNHRVMWLQREGSRENILAINSLKVSKNPRMTVSLMQSSGDVTQSTLYIYNVAKNDSGAYECSVNIKRGIQQVGTLDVVDLMSTGSDNEGSHNAAEKEKSTTTKNVIRLCDKEKDITNDCTIDIHNQDDSENVFCIDLGLLWEKARLKVDNVLSSVYTFFMKLSD